MLIIILNTAESVFPALNTAINLTTGLEMILVAGPRLRARNRYLIFLNPWIFPFQDS